MEKRLDDSDRYIGSLQEKIKTLVNDKDALAGRAKSLEEEKELYKVHNRIVKLYKYLDGLCCLGRLWLQTCPMVVREKKLSDNFKKIVSHIVAFTSFSCFVLFYWLSCWMFPVSQLA